MKKTKHDLVQIKNPRIRIWKGDRWTRMLGSKVPEGASVQVVRFLAFRRVLVSYEGEPINTMLWCLRKEK